MRTCPGQSDASPEFPVELQQVIDSTQRSFSDSSMKDVVARLCEMVWKMGFKQGVAQGSDKASAAEQACSDSTFLIHSMFDLLNNEQKMMVGQKLAFKNRHKKFMEDRKHMAEIIGSKAIK